MLKCGTKVNSCLIKYHYSGSDFNSFVYGNIKHKSLAVTESYVMCVLRVCLSHGPLFRADGSHLPLIGQCLIFQPSDWSQTSWCVGDQVCYRGWHRHMSRQLWRTDDSHAVVTRLRPIRGEYYECWPIRERIKSIDQWEPRSVFPRVYCNDNWGHIKCDGDFLAHNECIVNITLLKYKYKTDCKTYHFQNSVWCICLATLVKTRRSILDSVCPDSWYRPKRDLSQKDGDWEL